MTEATQVVTPKVKTKKAKMVEGDLFLSVANEVENLTKAKALTMAADLANDVETNYFKLGGVLKVINENQWYEGFEDFGDFVFERYGFQKRKAFYLIEIYVNLIEKAIPYEKVAPLGWTKLRALSPVLTTENVDEWVAKAMPLTVKELLALLKGSKDDGDKDKTTDEIETLKFKCHADQAATIKSALNKAKAQGNTDFDTVALEYIAIAYLGDALAMPEASLPTDAAGLGALFQKLGIEKVFEAVDVAFGKDYSVNVEPLAAAEEPAF
jgi:hypothetical protein